MIKKLLFIIALALGNMCHATSLDKDALIEKDHAVVQLPIALPHCPVEINLAIHLTPQHEGLCLLTQDLSKKDAFSALTTYRHAVNLGKESSFLTLYNENILGRFPFEVDVTNSVNIKWLQHSLTLNRGEFDSLELHSLFTQTVVKSWLRSFAKMLGELTSSKLTFVVGPSATKTLTTIQLQNVFEGKKEGKREISSLAAPNASSKYFQSLQIALTDGFPTLHMLHVATPDRFLLVDLSRDDAGHHQTMFTLALDANRLDLLGDRLCTDVIVGKYTCHTIDKGDNFFIYFGDFVFKPYTSLTKDQGGLSATFATNALKVWLGEILDSLRHKYKNPTFAFGSTTNEQVLVALGFKDGLSIPGYGWKGFTCESCHVEFFLGDISKFNNSIKS